MSRTIVVTGAASGIDQAAAAQLEAAGDTVIRVDLREGDVTGDLGDRASVDRVAAEITERTGGRIDGLVTNAGVSAPNELSVKINVLGTVWLIEALRPLLAAGTDPRVSVTSSAATLQHNDPELVDLLLAGDAEAAIARGAALAEQGPLVGYANDSSSKRAISRWIRRVAPTPEYAGADIGLNAVGPGQVRTGMTKDLFASVEGRRQAADAMPTPTTASPRRSTCRRARLPGLHRERAHDRSGALRGRRLRRAASRGRHLAVGLRDVGSDGPREVRAERCVSVVVARVAVRIRLGAQPIRDLLLRAGRRRLVVLELWDRRLARS